MMRPKIKTANEVPEERVNFLKTVGLMRQMVVQKEELWKNLSSRLMCGYCQLSALMSLLFA